MDYMPQLPPPSRRQLKRFAIVNGLVVVLPFIIFLVYIHSTADGLSAEQFQKRVFIGLVYFVGGTLFFLHRFGIAPFKANHHAE